MLKQEVPRHVQTGEVAQALQKTDELEGRIQAFVDDLAQVNAALNTKSATRAALERQLQTSLERAGAGGDAGGVLQSNPQDFFVPPARQPLTATARPRPRLTRYRAANKNRFLLLNR